MRRVFRALALVAAAVVCAAISNAFAGSERKLLWTGNVEASSFARASDDKPAKGPIVGARSAEPAKAPAAVSPSNPAKTEFPPHPDKPWVEVSSEDAFLLFSRKTVPFLDARRTSVYAEGHIAGARPFSVWEADVDEKVKKLYEEGLDQNAPLVVYCSGGDCEDSHMLAQKLYMVGFNNVLVYKDGFPDWQKRGLPVSKGNAP